MHLYNNPKIEGYRAFAINWNESERGMGQRSDGISLHLTKDDAEAFKKLPLEGNSEAYSFPASIIMMVIIEEAQYQEMLAKKENDSDYLGTRHAFPRSVQPGQVVVIR